MAVSDTTEIGTSWTLVLFFVKRLPNLTLIPLFKAVDMPMYESRTLTGA